MANPDILYHYCGVNGFLGIIQSKVLWLSIASMMNDYMEQKWLLNKAIQQLRKFRGITHQHLIKLLREILNHDNSPSICCFSSEPDLLSQWRAYCDDGAGYAIGFSKKELESLISKHKSLSLIRVNYEEDEQEAMIAPLVVEKLTEIINQYKRDKMRNPKKEVVDLGYEIRKIAMGCKNPGFMEEREWRIVYEGFYSHIIPWKVVRCDFISDISFRNSGTRLVPYFTLPFPVDAIKEIRLGPKNFARENRESLRSLLFVNGYDYRHLNIINSEATYR
jgi:hypothetical protein